MSNNIIYMLSFTSKHLFTYCLCASCLDDTVVFMGTCLCRLMNKKVLFKHFSLLTKQTSLMVNFENKYSDT